MIQKRILWMNEAAAEAGVSTVTLHKEIHAGRLRSVKIPGKRRYILRDDLERWMNGLPLRSEAEVESFQQIGETMKNPTFLEFFKNVPAFVEILKNLNTNPNPEQERKIEND